VADTACVQNRTFTIIKKLRGRIEGLRVQQSKAVNPKSIKHKMNDENKDAMIELLRLKVKDLEHKNKELTKQLQKHQGNIYDQI
jgi:hypothetical protein